MKNKLFSLVGILTFMLVFGMMVNGCVTGGVNTGGGAPATCVRGACGETTILLRTGLDIDQAFREVIFVLNRHGFNPEMMQQEAGFIRTGWNHQWVTAPAPAIQTNMFGRPVQQQQPQQPITERYRVRVIAQFNPARTQLILNPEGEWLENGVWIRGFDTRAVETLRNDITMVIGN
ncbi:MAG: hypothetical protein LBC80_09960 [Treponema sp.]|nr:hypothetical protein [Treponema sp.]